MATKEKSESRAGRAKGERSAVIINRTSIGAISGSSKRLEMGDMSDIYPK